MKLPNGDRAVVEPEKVRDYLLSPTHPVGRFKAAYFARFGYSQDSWELLRTELFRIAAEAEVLEGKFSRFGNKFEGSATLVGPSGASLSIVTVWIVRHGEDVPRFVTAIPGDKT
jgi:hypothetical protein